MKLEDGDISQYVVYDVDPRKICVSMQRKGFTFTESNKDKKIPMISDFLTRDSEFTGNYEQRINIEKYLEGGITTRSCYYRFAGSNGIGLGLSSFDPNCIVGFSGSDAFTSHTLKSLTPRMESVSLISNILDGKDVYTSSEITLQRFESNIGNIHEGSNGGRIKPDYIYSDRNGASEYAKAFKVPIIIFSYSSPEKYLEFLDIRKKSLLDERENRRSRNPGDIVLQARQIMTRDSQDIQVWENYLKNLDEEVSQMPNIARKKQRATQIISDIRQIKEATRETEEPNIE